MRPMINPGLLAAILAGPGGRGGPMMLSDVAEVNAELRRMSAAPRPEHVPAGQCRGCRTRISANKSYCLKCATAKAEGAEVPA